MKKCLALLTVAFVAAGCPRTVPDEPSALTTSNAEQEATEAPTTTATPTTTSAAPTTTAELATSDAASTTTAPQTTSTTAAPTTTTAAPTTTTTTTTTVPLAQPISCSLRTGNSPSGQDYGITWLVDIAWDGSPTPTQLSGGTLTYSGTMTSGMPNYLGTYNVGSGSGSYSLGEQAFMNPVYYGYPPSDITWNVSVSLDSGVSCSLNVFWDLCANVPANPNC